MLSEEDLLVSQWKLQMATILQINSSVNLSRHFFILWQHRNTIRQARWKEEIEPILTPTQSQLQFDNLHYKIRHLKTEIVSLIAQDIALFQQLFALQDAIMELKEQFEYCPSSSESSPYGSPHSTLASFNTSQTESKYTKRSASFVRQHVSYPPIARNRSRRLKPRYPQHGCQDSYDSGIHTSDHEIFV